MVEGSHGEEADGGIGGHVHQFCEVQRVEGEGYWECNHNRDICNATSGKGVCDCVA